MRKFKSAKQAQRFLSAAELIYQQLIYQHAQLPRHKILATTTKEMILDGIQSWKEITGVLVSISASEIYVLGILVIVYS